MTTQINQNKRAEWQAFKAAKTTEFEAYRGSDDYRRDFENLTNGLLALHPNFRTECARVVGEAVDVVSGGRSVEDLDRATKTNIGPAIERKFLERFGLPQLEASEKIDTRIGGVLVDIKTTIRDNWMIHVSCIGKWCLLFSEDCKAGTFNLGLAFVTADMMTSPNGDWKSSLSTEGKNYIHWIITDEPFQTGASELAGLREELASVKTALRDLTAAVRQSIQGSVAHA